MAAMKGKRREKVRVDWRSDWWLWPSALILAMGGWGQAMWMWENTLPEGLAPLGLLWWAGVGVAGLSLPIYWLARRWRPVAWVATAAWAGVPGVSDMAGRYRQVAGTADEWLYSVSPLLLLLLLGLGLSGAMMSLAGFAGQSQAERASKVRPLREGFWSGLFVVICGWLLINRAFTPAAATLLAGALVLIETYLVEHEA
jgi:hypothetical protein